MIPTKIHFLGAIEVLIREGKSLSVGKLPGFIFYPGDWMKDPELRSVSSEARGLWIDMLCLMFESQPRGYLLLRGGKAVTSASLSRMTGNLEAKIIQWIEELDDKGVLSRDDQGVIFCRKMVRDEQVRDKTKKRTRKYRERHMSVTEPSPVNVNVKEGVGVGSKEIGCDEAVSFVLNECGLAGRELRAVIHQQVFRQLEKIGAKPKDTAEAMVAVWKLYEATDIEYRKGAEKFFGGTDWRKGPEWWNKKNGKTEQLLSNLAAAKASFH